MNALFDQLAARGNLSLSDAQHDGLSRYLDLLLAANQTMNLTRITDRAAAEGQHIGDALTVLPFLPKGTHALADVGTGGGVPGIPLAIARPDARVTLVESTQKKVSFLRDAVAQLQLPNVTVIASRAEDAGKSGAATREAFDIVVARAVATMVWLAEWCLPLCKVGGAMLAMKGPKVLDELPEASKAIRLLGGAEPEIHAIELPGTQGHVILRIAKRGHTSPKFPRDPTFAKKKPIA